jgi:hopene-associated glycosyltransferase HpnB
MTDVLWIVATVPGAVLWLVILLLPWRPWGTRESLEASPDGSAARLDDVTVLIPARNEAATIGHTLAALRLQGPDLQVTLVDDRSDDGTAEAARSAGHSNLRVVSGEPMPSGWTGKLWALEQGLAEVKTGYILLLDADIALANGTVALLLDFTRRHRLQMVSLMASLSMIGFWEKLLMPAFVYFFKLLYPFRLSNSPNRWVAAAAGGCILVETRVLRELGGFSAMRGELIDDCALARRVKRAGHRIWIGLSRSVTSHRRYRTLGPIWDMVARTAFTQLHYSPLLLAGCTLALATAFWIPVAGVFAPVQIARIASVVALHMMMLTFLPILRFYDRSILWAGLLPVVGTLYMAMTIDSARRYYAGVRSSWRGRVYESGQGR